MPSFLIKKSSLFIVLLLSGMACQRTNRIEPVVRTAFRMDTLVKISIFDAIKSKEEIDQLIDTIFVWMESAENRLSFHIKNSDVQKINDSAGRKAISVSNDVYKVIEEGKKISQKTAGTFDITIGGIKELWDFHNNSQIVPSEKDIQTQLNFVNTDYITLDFPNITLKKAGTHLDLGGIAKGYMVDQAIYMLRKAGVQAAIVEAGGDLRILGNHPNKPMWRIGVRHPRNPQDLYGILTIDSVSVTTSGDYERYFEKNGKRYHHILDPKIGYPATKSISVTIVAPSAMLADALATALFVMGPEQGVAYAEKHAEVECLILYEVEDKIFSKMSTGMKSMFKEIK